MKRLKSESQCPKPLAAAVIISEVIIASREVVNTRRYPTSSSKAYETARERTAVRRRRDKQAENE